MNRPPGDLAAYRPDIDGLRAVAILSVLGYHFFPRQVPAGFVGVDIFFVISGFLISRIILDELATGNFSFANFYARRARRLFPALSLVLIASLAFGWLVLFPDEYRTLGKHAAGGAGFISNLLYWRESGYFDAESSTKPLFHLWSLGVEEQFYLIFPVFVYGAYKSRPGAFRLIVMAGAVSLAYNLRLGHLHEQATDFYSPLSRFWEFSAGAALAGARAVKWPAFLTKYNGPAAGHAASVLGAALFFLAVFTFRERPSYPGHWAITPVAGAALLIAAGPAGFFNRRLLALGPAIAIGLISYPLYLWHWPVFVYLRLILGEPPGLYLSAIAAGLSLALAGLTYLYAERPLRFGLRWRPTAVLAGLMAAAAGAGLLVNFSAGLPDRALMAGLEGVYGAPEAEPPRWRGKDCGAYAGFSSQETSPVRQGYFSCLFADAGGTETVALIGDSHALSVFPGLAKYNAALGLNTLIFADGNWLPPLVGGVETVAQDRLKNNQALIADYKKVFDETFAVLRRQADVKAVFIMLHKIKADIYRACLQPTIDLLAGAGKKVFIVADWPTLFKSRLGSDYLPRPFRSFFSAVQLDADLDKDLLLKHEADYQRILAELKNAVIIQGASEAFCPDRRCLVFSGDGRLLYSDSTHLTETGSEFFVRRTLAPWLDGLAESGEPR